LFEAVKDLGKDIGIYLVGGEPTKEYIEQKERLGLTNLYFVPFKKKEEIKDYYKAADLFVLPTREDCWGLVINEAMAAGLAVITTNMCIAGAELVKDDENGYIVNAGSSKELYHAIVKAFSDEEKLKAMGKSSLSKIKDYTIENMAKVHMDIFLKD